MLSLRFQVMSAFSLPASTAAAGSAAAGSAAAPPPAPAPAPALTPTAASPSRPPPQRSMSVVARPSASTAAFGALRPSFSAVHKSMSDLSAKLVAAENEHKQNVTTINQLTRELEATKLAAQRAAEGEAKAASILDGWKATLNVCDIVCTAYDCVMIRYDAN